MDLVDDIDQYSQTTLLLLAAAGGFLGSVSYKLLTSEPVKNFCSNVIQKGSEIIEGFIPGKSEKEELLAETVLFQSKVILALILEKEEKREEERLNIRISIGDEEPEDEEEETPSSPYTPERKEDIETPVPPTDFDFTLPKEVHTYENPSDKPINLTSLEGSLRENKLDSFNISRQPDINLTSRQPDAFHLPSDPNSLLSNGFRKILLQRLGEEGSTNFVDQLQRSTPSYMESKQQEFLMPSKINPKPYGYPRRKYVTMTDVEKMKNDASPFLDLQETRNSFFLRNDQPQQYLFV